MRANEAPTSRAAALLCFGSAGLLRWADTVLILLRACQVSRPAAVLFIPVKSKKPARRLAAPQAEFPVPSAAACAYQGAATGAVAGHEVGAKRARALPVSVPVTLQDHPPPAELAARVQRTARAVPLVNDSFAELPKVAVMTVAPVAAVMSIKGYAVPVAAVGAP